MLASNSPRRRQLLSIGGWDFQVYVAQVDEQVRIGEMPADYVRRLAAEKAQAVAAALEASDDVDLIIAADTAVVDREHLETDASPGEVILGKPVDEAEADRMLRRLRGRTHQVYTGLAVLRVDDGSLRDDVCVTDVPMRAYSDEEIHAYIASGDPMDKAGAYAIQHPGFHPVEDLDGCYANVMGLPVCHLAVLLGEFGVAPGEDIPSSCREGLGHPCEIFRQVLGPASG